MSEIKKLKILIVDDRPDNLRPLEKLLQGPEREIITAGSGNEALSLVLEHDIALILLDVQMPDMDGFETAELIRGNSDTGHIPIIFVTAINKEEKHIFKGYETGAVDYLFKPIEHHILKSKVQIFLELHQQKLKLEELNNLKTKFLGIAAHDLRNHIVSIRGFSEMLLKDSGDPLSEEQGDFLTLIHDVSEDMLALLNDLLDISMIESGKITLQLTAGTLKELVEERVRIYSVVGHKKNITLHQELADLPESLFDANRISQIIDNLISNAIKFSSPDTNIYISLSQEEKMARVSVRDEGPGIAPADQKKIFGEFQKLSARPTAGEKSTGLGLSIAKKAVEAHGGNITVESQVNIGSTFSFSIPLEVSK